MCIYIVKIMDIIEDELNKILLLIDSDKRKRIEVFINKKDKIRTLVGDILIRTIISKELGLSNGEIKFKNNLYGKPYLENYDNFHFNITHSEDYVVCTVGECPVGCDIEKIKDIDYETISKNYFTSYENKYITKNDLVDQLGRFYEIWTLKESYVKCCGIGLSLLLNSFSIKIDEDIGIRVFVHNECKVFFFEMLDIDCDYKLSICSKDKKIDTNIVNVDQTSLLIKFSKLCYEKGEK